MTGRADRSHQRVWPPSYTNRPEANGHTATAHFDVESPARLTNFGARSVSEETHPFEQITIPRPQYWGRRQHIVKETYVQDGHSEPGEIIERISDEFRFLEECNNPPPQRTSQSLGRYGQFSSNKYVFVTLAVIQIITAILLMVFASFRYLRLYNRNNTDTLMDFVKIEDYVQSNNDGTELISIKTGTSVFLPAIMQLAGGFAGLYPLRRRPPKSFYILHVWFMSLSILFWFRPTFYAALELNLRNVQLDDAIDSVTYRLLIALFCVVAIDVFVVNSILLIQASTHLSSAIRTQNHVTDLYVIMLSVIMSALCLSLSIYVSIYTLTNVSSWIQSAKNMFALYGFGLREVIVCSFVFLTCLFACFATLSRRKNLRLTVVVIQTLSLLVLLASLLNEDRMIATAHNIRTMFTQGISQPIGAESLLLLYVFLILLTVMLVVQVVANILNVFHSPACELHTLKTTGSAGPPTVAQHQSQF